MAAHVVTGLNQLIAHQFTVEQFHYALVLSSWTEDLAMVDWKKFTNLVESDDVAGIIEYAQSILPIYQLVWNLLGQPRDRESWIARRYDGDLRWFDCRTDDNKTYIWKTRNPASVVIAIRDVFGATVSSYKLRRNKRWISVS